VKRITKITVSRPSHKLYVICYQRRLPTKCASRFTFYVSRRFAAPDGLLRRHIAIYVPAACVAGFENSFVFIFKIARLLRGRGKHEGVGDEQHDLS